MPKRKTAAPAAKSPAVPPLNLAAAVAQADTAIIRMRLFDVSFDPDTLDHAVEASHRLDAALGHALHAVRGLYPARNETEQALFLNVIEALREACKGLPINVQYLRDAEVSADRIVGIVEPRIRKWNAAHADHLTALLDRLLDVEKMRPPQEPKDAAPGATPAAGIAHGEAPPDARVWMAHGDCAIQYFDMRATLGADYRDLGSVNSASAGAKISKACKKGRIAHEGSHKGMRIDAASFAVWLASERDRLLEKRDERMRKSRNKGNRTRR